MNNAVEYVSFKLKRSVLEEDFILVSDKFNTHFLEKQKGYISRRVVNEGDVWADLVLWETAQDHLNAMEKAKNSDVAKEYLSMLNLSAKGSSYHLYISVKEY